jgi:signal transduction histidine kinase
MLDTTEIRQKERELTEKNAELERFTYMISHDLKSPVVTVKTFLGYLEQDLGRSDAARIGKDMLYIRTAADRMGRLLDELLEMSRVGRVANPMEHVTFRELVDEALGMVAGPIAERGVALLVGDEAVTLYGDRPRLVEIWQNLVENAVKFMGDQPSPRIEIGVEPRGRDTLFFVRDNGMGVDMRYNKKIFGLFEKLDAQAEGTGLGLALVKRIVELCQGTIWLESEGPGQGACFRFTLPAAVQGNVKGDTQ